MTREAAKTQDTPTTHLEAVSLPSPNILHENTLVRELTTRLSQFDTALEVVTAEREGKQLRHEQAMAEAEEKHRLSMAELQRQAEDIDRGRRRLLRALEDEREGEE